VQVPTHVAGTLAFANGALIQICTSFDVAGHKHVPLEIYGTEASLIVPDPNQFGGQIALHTKGGDWAEVPTNQPYADDNYRSIGLADMALAILENRPHRASGELALHVLEVMEAFQRSSDTGRAIDITTPVARPAPLADSLRDGKLQ
jgi:predicted dehydrogenase